MSMLETLLVNMLLFAGLILFLTIIVFFVAQKRQDNSVMDIAYGPIFSISALFSLLLSETVGYVTGTIFCILCIWSARLSFRIFKKNYGKPEDVRYAAWRQEWSLRGREYFLLRSFLQINLLQGFIILLVSMPFILALSFSSVFSPWYLVVGSLLSIFGIIYESLADRQLDAFLTRKRAGTEPAPLMQIGLFTYSRRPNYFGETLVWWGLAVIVWPLPFGYLGVISPLVITYIVTKVTGPMLEKIFLDKYPVEYTEYIKTTSYFIPWFKKKHPK